ncbi:suppressor of SWI4 1 homolog [Pygocentrus nattereri]|uniref:suppressor of SWI4 1 homolog n=1 Tax=Pygocentrus nattereri TaxID=42514 RepID=UPI0018915F91|nr:suppressor of SWI4 1 homolog [Pygocentrus nattereri]
MDVLYCKKRIESLLAFVKEKRSEGAFPAVYAKAADLTSDPQTNAMRKLRLSQLQDPKERYRNLYMAILDNLTEQLPRRFANLESLRFLESVNPGKFDEMRQVFPEEAFQSVLESFGQFFDSGRLRSELQVLYSNQDLQGNRGKLCDFLLFLKDMELDSAMLQVYKLLSLVATIGATSAGVERSFSCLKRLKSYTRNTMGQGRLSSLALLAIERTLVKSLEKTPCWYNRATDHFLEKERRTKNQKAARVTSASVAEEEYGTVLHSFVFHRGLVGKNIDQLVTDMRFERKNVLKDFVTAAGPLGVTHFLIFTKTETNVNLRLARLPKGPTLFFHVTKYSLIKDVVSSLKRHRMHEQQFSHHPLLVLNNFALDGMHIKLMATMFQNMFPSINVHTVNINNIKRCVLLTYDPESKEIDFRHYSLKVVPVGMSRGVKKLMQEKLPNMNKLEDISDLLLQGVNLSESEAEQDGDHNITELPQVYSGRGNMRSQQSAVRLTEIGPRMTLQLVKITEGMGDGNVLYHSIHTKTEEELMEILKRKEARLKEKAERKQKQEQNIALKKQKRDENKKKSLEGMKKKRQQEGAGSDDSEVEDPGMQEDQAAAEESEDEAEYYRQAVGQEPDEDMFPTAKRKHGPGKSPRPFKKRKTSSSKASDEKQSPRPAGKPAFGGKASAGKKFGGKKFGVGGKGFGARKTAGTGSKFGKSKWGKKFGENKRDGFGGNKNGPKKGPSSKLKGQRSKTGSGFKAGPRGGKAKKDFKQKKARS